MRRAVRAARWCAEFALGFGIAGALTVVIVAAVAAGACQERLERRTP